MAFYLNLAWRNIWRNRRRSIISMASILFAVMLAIMSRSLMIGVFSRMVDTVVSSFSGYMQVHATGYFESQSLDDSFVHPDSLARVIVEIPRVTYTVPRVESFALVSAGNRTDGARIIGIDPASEDRMTHLKKRISSGRYLEKSDRGVILGEALAKDLKKTVGDTVVLLGSGYHGITAAGKYPVLGIVTFPAEEMSAALVYLPLKEAQYLFGVEGRVTTIAVQIEDARFLASVADRLRATLDTSYEVITWKQMMPELDQLVQMKYVSQDLVLGLIYIIVGFGILGTVLMMTMERMREFGMVTALGMKRRVLAMIVVIESVMLTLVGALAAMLLTWPILAHLHANPIQLTGQYAQAYQDFGFEPVLAFALQLPIFLWQTVFVVVIALIAAGYPLFRIAKLNPVEAMRTVH